MKKRFGQAAMEYLLIFVFAIFILIPGIYLFRNYVSDSNDDILMERLRLISANILDEARDAYYMGVPSKSVIEVDMPPSITNMGILFNDHSSADPSDDEYILVFIVSSSDGPIPIFFDSDIPLKAEEDNMVSGNADILQYPAGGCDDTDFITQCESPKKCECFPEKDYSEGIKLFKIEATDDDCYDGNICISIDEVSNELSSS